MEKNLLEIKNLVVQYVVDGETVEAVNGIDLEIGYGETLGLVGETGAGKTTTALSVMGLIPNPPGRMVSGEIIYDGRTISGLKEKEYRKIRGGEITMIFQDPMTSLNPVMTVGEQIAEVVRLHAKCSRLEAVELLIADEPTTALDVTIQAQVLELMNKLKQEFGTAMLLITHDLGVVAEVCDSVAIIYAGEIVERGSLSQVYGGVCHPYTQGLFDSLPDLDEESERLKTIQGMMPDPSDLPRGCKFHPRCPNCTDQCKTENPPVVEVEPGHKVKCWLAQEGGEP